MLAPLLLLLVAHLFVFGQSDEVVKIIEVCDGEFLLDESGLQSILSGLDPDTKVAVIAITGEYRKGKSFLMNFFLQYLSHREQQPKSTEVLNPKEMMNAFTRGEHTWLKDVDQDGGFQFKAGRGRRTEGISVWSTPHVIQTAGHRKIAVLLMDSQGLYDSDTSLNDNVSLFTMISLLSSSLMVNVAQNLNSKQLMEVEYCMDYGTTVSDVEEGQRVFQRLTFVIRDYTLDQTYGWAGGQAELNQFMLPTDSQAKQTYDMARNLTLGFTAIDAYTLPPPGPRVIRKDYDGSLSQIDPEFLLHVHKLVIDIVEQVDARRPHGLPLTAATFVQYVKNLTEVFKTKDSPYEVTKMSDRDQKAAAMTICDQEVKRYVSIMAVRVFSDEFYLMHDAEEIMEQVTWDHLKAMGEVIKRLSSRANKDHWVATFKVTEDSAGAAVTGLQYLRSEMDKTFERWHPQYERMQELLREQALIREEGNGFFYRLLKLFTASKDT